MPDKNHSFANPGPAGLIVLAFYLSALFPLATHVAPPELAGVLVGLGFAGGTIQLVSGVIELRNGMILPGNIMLAFSTFMFLGMFENLFKIIKWLPADSAPVDGYIFILMGILMIGLTPGFLYKNLASGLFMITTDIFFVSGGLSFLFGISGLFTIFSWDIPLVIITIIWQVFGDINNEVFGKTVVSLGAPLLKKA